MRVGEAVSIGEMRHRITFRKFTVTTNQNGFEVEEWQDYMTVWSEVSNLSGREYYQVAAVQAEKTVKFTIRYLSGLNTDMRILYDCRQYNITAIDNFKYENRFIEIKAQEVDSSG